MTIMVATTMILKKKKKKSGLYFSIYNRNNKFDKSIIFTTFIRHTIFTFLSLNLINEYFNNILLPRFHMQQLDITVI